VQLGQELVAALSSVWRVINVAEGWRWVRKGLEIADDTTPPATVARLYRVGAFLNMALLHYEAAREFAMEALGRFGELSDEKEIAVGRYLAGRALVALGRIAEAQTMLEPALVTFRRLRAGRLTGVTLGTLAIAREDAREYETARAMFEEALGIFSATNDDRDEAVVATHLGWIELLHGNVEAALRLQRSALATFRNLSDRTNAIDALTGVADCLLMLDRYDDARAHAREALTLAAADRMDVHVAMALQHLAAFEVRRPKESRSQTDSVARAANLLGYVNACFARIGFRRTSGEPELYERVIEALRNVLGDAELAKLMAEGSAWNEERAVAEGLKI
jgi:tetratricopeptide (TPR) repeat protein